MQRFARIEGTVVGNVVEAQQQPAGWVPCGEASPGWLYDEATGTFSPPPPPVPQAITRAQGKAALIQAGLWPAVLQFVDGITDPLQKAMAQVAIHDTLTWRRDSEFLQTASAALGITHAQMDALFVTASAIEL